MLCRQCGKLIPKWIEAKGKTRQTSNRRTVCFECKPWSFRTAKIGEIRHCEDCDKDYIRTSTHRLLKKCASCSVNKRRKGRKLDLIAYKGGKCVICGYSRCVQALIFHHLNPSEKEFTISGRNCLSLDRLKAEVDKCILVCAICHNEIHAGFLNFNGTEKTGDKDCLFFSI